MGFEIDLVPYIASALVGILSLFFLNLYRARSLFKRLEKEGLVTLYDAC